MADNGRADPEALLVSYFGRYEPAMARLGKALRAKLRRRLPGLFEIVYVYERQSALVISYSPTEHGHEGVCGVALYPDGAKLFFGQGALLAKSDPSRLLQGRAKARHVPVGRAADLDRADVRGLIEAALELANVRIDPAAKGSVLIRAEAQKRRAERRTAPRATATRSMAGGD